MSVLCWIGWHSWGNWDKCGEESQVYGWRILQVRACVSCKRRLHVELGEQVEPVVLASILEAEAK